MEHKVSDTLQKYYDQIFQDGKLVNINISIWGMSYSLKEEDIKINDKLPDLIQLGKKMLIKPAVLNLFKSFEGKARRYLYANSFSFPLVSQSHFVPRKKYIEVYKQLCEFRREFKEMTDEFVENYEDYKNETIQYYEQFKDQISVDNLESYYPSKQAVAEKFAFDIVSFEIKLPTEFGNTDIHREAALEQAEVQARKASEAIYKAEYSERLNTHMGKINEFVGEVIGTIRAKVLEHCSLVLKKVNKREVVSDKSISILLSQINEFRQMNFIEDKGIETELGKLETLLNKGSNFSKDKDAVQELKTSLTNIIEEAKGVTDVAALSGQYFRKLSI